MIAPSGQATHQGRGAPDRGEYREAAEAASGCPAIPMKAKILHRYFLA